MDLGACPKSHTGRLRTEYKREGEEPDRPRLRAHPERVLALVDECDKRIRAAYRRLEKTPEENAKTTNLMREIGEIELAIQGGMEKIETLGEQGKVEKLRVCDVCGAHLSVLDSDRRLDDHFGGKVLRIPAPVHDSMGVWRIIDAVVTYLYFLLTPYNNDKTVIIWHHPLNVRSRAVPPLVDDTTYQSERGIRGLVELIRKNARHTHYVPYYDGLARCAVTAVWHLRSEKTMHEIVVVEYTMSVDSGSDTRFARFERFHVPNDSHRKQKLLRTVTGLDSVQVSDSWDDLGHNYAVVQTLSAIPPGRLDILDVVALAEVVGGTAQKYSNLAYVCQWHAAALFGLLLARLHGDYGTYKRGQAYNSAGTGRFAGIVFRLVDVESAALLFPSSDATPEVVEDAIREVWHRQGLDSDTDDLRTAIHRDAELLRTNRPTLASIQTAADKSIPELHHMVKENAAETEEIILRAKRVQAAEERAEHVREALQHVRAQLAERDARIADLMRRLGSASAASPTP